MDRALVWFRGKDLRIADHTPLRQAAQGNWPICVFVLDPYFFAPERAARLPHRMQFLLESIAAVREQLRALGSELILVRGKSVEVIPRLVRDWKIQRLLAYRWTEPFGRERDRRIAEAIRIPFELHEGETLLAPDELKTGTGTPFAVYGAFKRAFLRKAIFAAPLPAPPALPQPPLECLALTTPLPTLADLLLTPNPKILSGGEPQALQRLTQFIAKNAATYAATRDQPDLSATSRVSQDLHFGTLSAKTVWFRTTQVLAKSKPSVESLASFQSELIWREFAHHVLYHHPRVLSEPFRREFDGFPVRNDEADWERFSQGLTGYPLVDAAARQLLSEGFVHNRARMVVASFLTKHLLQDYRRGEAHYLRFLTDGDWAVNNFNWQWCAGTGADAAAYYRVFNPVLQGTRFDATGNYVRRYLPELARIPNKYIHCPWQAPSNVLRDARVELGKEYPLPIVDHAHARERYLQITHSYLGSARA